MAYKNPGRKYSTFSPFLGLYSELVLVIKSPVSTQVSCGSRGRRLREIFHAKKTRVGKGGKEGGQCL